MLRIRDHLARQAAEGLIGRAEESAALLQCLEPGGPHVVHVHGVAGMGKSSLLEAFAAEARSGGATIVRLDCRGIEPTSRGFLYELVGAIGGDAATVDEAADRLGRLSDRVVLALDTYEVFRLMDAWLRQVFAPALPDNVRLILVGREPPAAMWLAAPGWYGLCTSLTLGPLADEDALELLRASGLSPTEARRLNRLARGHPLALRLAAAAAAERPDVNLEDVALQRIIDQLARLYLAEVSDPLTRHALEAASVVRRITVPLIGAMLPETAPLDAVERLRALPFVESARDGLTLHEAVQQAIAAELSAAEPERYREYRRRAWRELRSEVGHAGRSELWRYTADLLYLLENLVVREAFFPSGGSQVAIEVASAADEPAVWAIAERHAGRRFADLILGWSAAVPGSLRVARSRQLTVAGFYTMFDAEAARLPTAPDDPVIRRWLDHLDEHPLMPGECALFVVGFLDHEHAERPSAVQGAVWLDIKRAYMELRPHLRRVYLGSREFALYAPVFQKLGFEGFGSLDVSEGTYHFSFLDMGPGSVDGWLAGLVAAELGIEREELLDIDARELVVDGRRVALTQLEFGVMRYLVDREGKVASRIALERDVWGYDYHGGSNVVDVVVRALRKKLADRAALIETVHGAGYRLRRRA
jgi:Transcriptional regulatory protein, C terminal/AAA ATPase domain